MILLSPAKKQDFKGPHTPLESAVPASRLCFPEKTAQLIQTLKSFDETGLARLMTLSPSLAKLNAARYQTYETAPTRAALFAFQGEAYQSLESHSLTPKALEYAQSQLRILSGLYGLLRPFDQIKPHRLEMGTLLTIGSCTNLYAFWRSCITQDIIHTLKTNHQAPQIINLASIEYSHALDRSVLLNAGIGLIDIHFRQYRQGKYATIGIMAKRARGRMLHYLLNAQDQSIDCLQNFDVDGYRYQPDQSTQNTLVFVSDRI